MTVDKSSKNLLLKLKISSVKLYKNDKLAFSKYDFNSSLLLLIYNFVELNKSRAICG